MGSFHDSITNQLPLLIAGLKKHIDIWKVLSWHSGGLPDLAGVGGKKLLFKQRVGKNLAMLIVI